MKRILVYELIPGMVTAEDVYNYSDQLIIPKGATLTAKAISKLEFYAIAFIRVEDELDLSYSTAKASSSAFLDDESSAPSYKDRVRTSEQFKRFKDEFEQEVRDFKTQINEVITKNAPLDVDKLFEDSLNLMSMETAVSVSSTCSIVCAKMMMKHSLIASMSDCSVISLPAGFI